jgi:heme/copper-type cytochrome/quinol oxidase subunit 1
MTFILFLVFSIPVGLHHLFMDPEHGAGFKFVQSVLTFIVYFWLIPAYIAYYTLMPQAAGGRLYSDTNGRPPHFAYGFHDHGLARNSGACTRR